MSAPVLPPPAVRQAVEAVLGRMMALVTAAGDVVTEAAQANPPSLARIDALMVTTTDRVEELGEAMGRLVGVVRAASASAPPTDEARS